jgi:hypothetical protein
MNYIVCVTFLDALVTSTPRLTPLFATDIDIGIVSKFFRTLSTGIALATRILNELPIVLVRKDPQVLT